MKVSSPDVGSYNYTGEGNNSQKTVTTIQDVVLYRCNHAIMNIYRQCFVLSILTLQ